VIRLGHAPHDHHAALYVAASNPDYFKEHGGIYLREITPHQEYILVKNEKAMAKVRIDSSTGGKKLIRKLDENLLDLSFGGVPAILSYIDQGSPIHILIPSMTEGAGFIMNKDFPANTWQEFVAAARSSKQPLRIGYKIDISVQNLIFETALEEESLSFTKNIKNMAADIQLINLYGAKNLIPALKTGIIDGFVVMQPFVAKASLAGVGKRIAYLHELPPDGQWKGAPCCALVGNDSYVATNRDAVKSLLILLQRATTYIQNNSEQVTTQIAAWLGEDTAIEKAALPSISFTNELSGHWNKGIDLWIKIMISKGYFSNRIKKSQDEGKLSDTLYDISLFTEVQQEAARK